MPTEPSLAHLTLNNGHARQSPRSEVGEDTLALLTPLVAAGGGVLPAPFDTYHLTVVREPEQPGRATFTVAALPEGNPLVTCFCCWQPQGEARFWAFVGAFIDGQRRDFLAGFLPGGMPRRPQAVPWLAVLIWPGLALHPDAVGWLGDLERCVAWALIPAA